MSATTTEPVPARMSFADFIAWVSEQPEGQHFELFERTVLPMPAERATHAIVKTLIGRRLGNAIEEQRLDYTVIVDDFVVRVDDATGLEPDVVVRPGSQRMGDALWADDPLIAVEVLSTATRTIDKSRKLDAYFRLPSLHHYLIVDADRRRVVHHLRHPNGYIETRLSGDAPIALDPPGLVLDRFFS